MSTVSPASRTASAVTGPIVAMRARRNGSMSAAQHLHQVAHRRRRRERHDVDLALPQPPHPFDVRIMRYCRSIQEQFVDRCAPRRQGLDGRIPATLAARHEEALPPHDVRVERRYQTICDVLLRHEVCRQPRARQRLQPFPARSPRSAPGQTPARPARGRDRCRMKMLMAFGLVKITQSYADVRSASIAASTAALSAVSTISIVGSSIGSAPCAASTRRQLARLLARARHEHALPGERPLRRTSAGRRAARATSPTTVTAGASIPAASDVRRDRRQRARDRPLARQRPPLDHGGRCRCIVARAR